MALTKVIGDGTGTLNSVTFGDSHSIGNQTTSDNLQIKSSSGENIVYDSLNGAHIFYKNGTENFRVNDDGEVRVTDNILLTASSKGIYLGVTSATASNLLDDYEEGTFTPGYNQSSANNVTLGKYTKIGNMVIVNIRLAVQQTGSTTALGKLTGLPFTIHDNCSHLTINTREYQTTGAHYHANLNPSTTESFTFTRYDNTATFSSGSDFGFGLTFAYAIQGS